MRTPTPKHVRARYWRAALAGERPATHEDDPQCGLYKLRMGKNAPWRPLKITLDQPYDIVTGELTDDEQLIAYLGDSVRCTHIETICRWWLSAARHPITVDEYAALMAEEHRRFRGVNLAA